MHVGTLIPHFKKGDFANLYLQIPEDMEYQRRVGDAYFSFCESIEKNHQINQTLEQMAQAIFKSWFVDFEPVKAKIAALEAGGSEEDALLAAMQAISGKGEAELTRLQAEQPEQYAELRATAELFPSAMQDSELGEIPEGWSVTSVNEIAEIVKGKSYKSAELEPSKTALVTLKSFNRGGGYRLDGLKEYTGKYKPQQEVAAGDLIIAYTDVTQAADVIGKPAMVIGDERYEHLIISLDVAVIRPIDASLKPYLYGLAKTDRFQYHTKAHTTGTTVLHLAKNAVPEFQLALPSTDLIDAYAGQANPLFTLINEKVQENRSLESLRDTLLPKLLSGELEMLKIAENAEDA
jgi:type I restriction enzyme S subunit